MEILLKNSIGNPLHICDFKEMIIRDHPHLKGISNNSISRCLKTNLKCSYQLYSKIPQKIFTEEMLRKIIESSLLLKELETRDSE